MALRTLFVLHAAATLAAGAVLVVWPALIPGSVGVHLGRDAYLLPYLLAATELGLSALSWGARNVTDGQALRVIVASIIVVHAASAVLEVLAFVRGGASSAIWGNIAFRVLVVALFGYFGRSPSP